MAGFSILERVRTAIELGESHFREFKSAQEGPPGKKVKRPARDIAINIGQTLVAFANADGGELLVGVEDDGIVTGLLDFSASDYEILERAPTTHVHLETPLPTVRKYRLEIDGKQIFYFSVSKSTDYVHLTSDGRCLQRRDLESLPVTAESIQFDRRERKSREYDREYVDGVSADDLDLNLVRLVADQIMKGMSAEKYLQYLDLGEYGLAQLRLRRAALLLFGKSSAKWHPRLQIRILKVDGDVIKPGEEYNVISDEVIAGNILTLADKAWEALRPHLIHTRFDKSARFEQRSIYPEYACREALLNAIAHRDYSDEGRGVEVFIFNSHLEIRNPGGLLSSIRIEDIASQKGVHQSRNAQIARVLRELGYMRELGEGMRRIYDLMHKNELAPPSLQSTPEGFSITLTHKPLYSERDLLWLSQFDQFDLDREQKTVLLLGQAGRVFSAKDVWDAVGIVDTEHYRKLVDSLIKLDILKNRVDREVAKSRARRSRVPFREYPRYGIGLPGENLNAPAPHSETQPMLPVADPEDIRDNSKRLYIGNLPWVLSQDGLFDLLAKYGDIEELSLPMQRGRSKGFGFVEFSSRESADRLLQADDLFFDGRKLAVQPAAARTRGRS